MNNAQMTACVYTHTHTHTHDRTLKARAGVAPHERAYIDETGERRRGSQRSYNAVERGSDSHTDGLGAVQWSQRYAGLTRQICCWSWKQLCCWGNRRGEYSNIDNGGNAKPFTQNRRRSHKRWQSIYDLRQNGIQQLCRQPSHGFDRRRTGTRKQTAVLCALLHNENLTPKAVAV